MGGAVIVMGKTDQTTRITFGPMEWVAIATLLITALCFLAGGVAVYREHDRDLMVLKTEAAQLKVALFDVQQDVKVLRADVSEMKALLTRRAEWPVKADAVLASQPPSVEMGVGQ